MDFSAMINRIIRALKLDATLYQEVEADDSLFSEAATIVVIVSVVSGIGAFFGTLFGGDGFGSALGALIGAIIMGPIAWVVQAYLVHYIGGALFEGQSTPREMMRTLGYAQAPNLLSILGIIPILGRVATVVGAIWALISTVIAAREGLDIDTGKAFVTCLIAFIVYLPLLMLSGWIF